MVRTLTSKNNQQHLAAWVQSVSDWIRRDNDEVVAVTGAEGRGKSSLAFLLAHKFDPGFKPARQVAFDASGYVPMASGLAPYKAAILDEAVRGGTSRGFQSNDNKRLTDYFTVARAQNLVHFICYPNVRWLDPLLREHRCRYNLHVVRRFERHAVAQLRLLKDDERIFEYPKVLFTFQFPAAQGPSWEDYKRAKLDYTQSLANGLEGQRQAREEALERMRGAIKPVVGRIVA